MRIKIDPNHIQFLRNLHKTGYTDAVIAGGAIRDPFFGNKPRDVDIFVNREVCTNPYLSSKRHLHASILKELSPNIAECDLMTRGHYYDNEIWEVWDILVRGAELKVPPTNIANFRYRKVLKKHEWNKFQLITIDRPAIEYVEEYFDVGLCQCWHDGIKAHYTDNFMRDYFNKTLTVCGKIEPKNLERIWSHHIPKLRAKFPGYQVVIRDPELAEHAKKLGLK